MASFLSRISNKIKDRQNKRAENNMNIDGFEQQNYQLINQGFNNPKANYKALSKANGNVQIAIQILMQKQQAQQQKEQLNQQRSQMKGTYFQEKKNLKIAQKLQKYEIQLQQLQPTIQQNNLGQKIQHFCSLGYDNQVKVAKVLLKCNGDLNESLQHIEKKSVWNKNKFKLPKECESSSNINQQNQFQNNLTSQQYFPPQNQLPSYQHFQQYAPQQQQQNIHMQQIQSSIAPQQQQQQFNYNYPTQKEIEQWQMSDQRNIYPNLLQLYYPQSSQNTPQYNQLSQQQTHQLNYDQMKSSQLQMKQQLVNSQNTQQQVDSDTMKQMIFSKQQEINQKQTHNKDQNIQIKDEDVEKYIQKNQFLISKGFKKAQKNIKVLIQCDGDENQALKILQQELQTKTQNKFSNKQNNQNNSSSSSSDFD